VKGLIVLAVILALLMLFGLLYLAVRAGGIRRQEFQNMETERDIATGAIREIEDKAALYKDTDSVLATDVRRIIDDSRKKYQKLRENPHA
jgi:hypothetical protein